MSNYFILVFIVRVLKHADGNKYEMNKREVGKFYEEKAVAYLIEQGMKIAEINFRNRQGEIDIIGFHDGYLVFVEVKYRKTQQMGSPVEAVTLAKQKIICKVADYYRFLHKIMEQTPVRYDVIAILDDSIQWYQNAFMHQGYRW